MLHVPTSAPARKVSSHRARRSRRTARIPRAIPTALAELGLRVSEALYRARAAPVSPLTSKAPADKQSPLVIAIHAAIVGEVIKGFRMVDHGAFVALELTDTVTSACERGRRLAVAQELLIAADFEVWPEGESLEVSRAEAPHFEHAEACACGAPGGFGCLCLNGGA